MLLRQLIQQPITSSKLFVCEPFRSIEREELVKEVIGLANADVDGPRYILFGVNPGAMDGKRVVGIDETAVADLKRAHRYISEMTEPAVSLAFIFDRFDGKIVGALEVDDCGEGPFVVGRDYSKELGGGKTWVREGRELREVDVAALAKPVAHESTRVLDEAELLDPLAVPMIGIGFNEDPESTFIELPIPDTSDPPFATERRGAEENSTLGESLRQTINTVSSQMLKFARQSTNESDSADAVKAAQDLFNEVDKHYYYEDRALHVNFVAVNKGTQIVRDVRIEFGFPTMEGFDIADRIYTSPFDKRSAAGTRNISYPDVEKNDRGFFVRNRIGVLEPNKPVPALKCALRMAVGPAAQNKKIAVLYTIRREEEVIGQGRLKIRFGDVVAEKQVSTA